jgi:hypothetical protein
VWQLGVQHISANGAELVMLNLRRGRIRLIARSCAAIVLTASIAACSRVPGAQQNIAPTDAATQPDSGSAVRASCEESGKAFGIQLDFLAGEVSTAAGASDWERFRGKDAGIVLGTVPSDAFAPEAPVTVCAFTSSELTPPLPLGAEPPDTLVISVGPDGSVTQEMMGIRDRIVYLLPSDLADSGELPNLRSQAPSATGQTFDVVQHFDVVASTGESFVVSIGTFVDGFCFGITATSACIDHAGLDGIGPTFAVLDDGGRVLISLVRADVSRVEIDLSDQQTVVENPTVWPQVGIAFDRRIGATMVPDGATVIGTHSFDSSGQEILTPPSPLPS